MCHDPLCNSKILKKDFQVADVVSEGVGAGLLIV